jgi:hypothetical protein
MMMKRSCAPEIARHFRKAPATAITSSTDQTRRRSISKSARAPPTDITICSDIDMMSSNADGRFAHKDGVPYPDP